MLRTLLAPEYTSVIPYVKPYLLSSFGSFIRMDYGTGHETSFALFLLCLTLVRFLQPEPEEERDIVLSVFLRYLKLCWKLQDVYRLEPAGSHGVWGLDDYSFLPYIFGSGQLRGDFTLNNEPNPSTFFFLLKTSLFLFFYDLDQKEITVLAITQPPLPPTNLYFMAIMRILDVKSGPFHEHSSQLYSIAVGVPNWGKVNSGLFKMYEVSKKKKNTPSSDCRSQTYSVPFFFIYLLAFRLFQAEVLGKRVVVQHIPLGGLLQWEKKEATSTSGPEIPPRDPNQVAVAWASPRFPRTHTSSDSSSTYLHAPTRVMRTGLNGSDRLS